MTDLEEHLRDGLRRLSSEMPTTDVTESSVRRGQRHRRRQSLAAAAGIAIAVAAIVVPLLVTGSSPTSQGRVGHAAPTIEPTPAGTPQAQPSAADQKRFRVAFPPLYTSGGGFIPSPKHECQAVTLRASADTESVTDGVVGVVTLAGPHCRMAYDAGVVALVDAAGRRVDVPLQPVSDRVPLNSFASGDAHGASFGFGWYGNTCDANVAGVQVRIRAGQFVVAAMPPPQRCNSTGDSVLIPGINAGYNGPVLPPPPTWSGLHPTLAATPEPARRDVLDLTLTLTNATAVPISFQPCASYTVNAQFHSTGIKDVSNSGGSQTTIGHGGTAGCRHALVVPANGSLPIQLSRFRWHSNQIVRRGARVRISVGIAGIGTAVAHFAAPNH